MHITKNLFVWDRRGGNPGAIIATPILSGLHHRYARIWFSGRTEVTEGSEISTIGRVDNSLRQSDRLTVAIAPTVRRPEVGASANGPSAPARRKCARWPPCHAARARERGAFDENSLFEGSSRRVENPTDAPSVDAKGARDEDMQSSALAPYLQRVEPSASPESRRVGAELLIRHSPRFHCGKLEPRLPALQFGTPPMRKTKQQSGPRLSLIENISSSVPAARIVYEGSRSSFI
jgi:hypothetical protein